MRSNAHSNRVKEMRKGTHSCKSCEFCEVNTSAKCRLWAFTVYQVEAERSGAFSRPASLRYASSAHGAATPAFLNALGYLAIYGPLMQHPLDLEDLRHKECHPLLVKRCLGRRRSRAAYLLMALHERGDQIDFIHLGASRRLRCEKCMLKIHRASPALRECGMKPRHF